MKTGARERLRRLRREALAGRAAWSIADQGLSSLSNIAVGIVAARSLSVEQFGTFGLVFTSYILVLGVGRGMISDPLLVRFSAQPTTRVPAGIAVAGAATLYGIVAGLLYAAAGVVVGGPILGVLVGFGLALPGLVLQDAWRYVAFSQARPQVAFLVDLVWGAGVAIGLIAVATQGALTLASILWVFGGTAGIAALAGMLVFRALPAVRAAVPFVRAHFDLGGRFMTEYLTTVGVTYLTVYRVRGRGIGFGRRRFVVGHGLRKRLVAAPDTLGGGWRQVRAGDGGSGGRLLRRTSRRGPALARTGRGGPGTTRRSRPARPGGRCGPATPMPRGGSRRAPCGACRRALWCRRST